MWMMTVVREEREREEREERATLVIAVLLLWPLSQPVVIALLGKVKGGREKEERERALVF
jgi:hypothetical protein